jgi:hypothetical protein
MIKFFTNILYKNNPKCHCGYKMKSTNFRRDEYSWKCIWVKKCGYEAYETFNGTIHWFKKK